MFKARKKFERFSNNIKYGNNNENMVIYQKEKKRNDWTISIVFCLIKISKINQEITLREG